MFRLWFFAVVMSLLATVVNFSYANQMVTDASKSESFDELVAKLPQAKLKTLSPIIHQLAQTSDKRVHHLFAKLLSGELYYRKADKRVIWVEKGRDKVYLAWDALTSESLEKQAKSGIKKIRTNNRLRSEIKSLLAQIDLTDQDKNVRLQAVNRILNKPNKKSIALLKALVDKETDADVRDLMQIGMALQQLKDESVDNKIAATEILKASLEPSVKNALQRELDAVKESASTSHGERLLEASLTKALEHIDSKRSLYQFIENLFFGLSLGSVLLLAAIGLAITFGVMGVINMAHGEMIMLGAYTTYVVQQLFPELLGYSLLIAVPAAFVVSGCVGILIERGVIRFLKGRPLETLLATFGISLVLQQLVRTVFSPLNRQVASPEWMSGSWQINPIFSLTYNRLYIILFSLMVFFALLAILKKTSLGLHVRAVSQNREMARALSIKSDWVDAVTFGLGSGIAGIAGVVLSQLTNVGPNLGQAYIIDSFLVVVFGGVGNLWGTLVAAMSLGTINKFLEPAIGSVLANILVLVGIVLFMQKRPKGLFPQKGRSAD